MKLRYKVTKTITRELFDGSAFRTERLRRKISMCEIARRSGISAPYLSDLERGNRNCSDEVLEKLIAALEKKCTT